jgi:hypothetical protein
LDVNPHLGSIRDRAAILRYATNLARIERVYAWLDEQSDAVFADSRRGKVHPVYERLEKWEAAADRAEGRLALSPRVRLELFALPAPGSSAPVDRALVTDPGVRAAARQLVDAAARARAVSANRKRGTQLNGGGDHE